MFVAFVYAVSFRGRGGILCLLRVGSTVQHSGIVPGKGKY